MFLFKKLDQMEKLSLIKNMRSTRIKSETEKEKN